MIDLNDGSHWTYGQPYTPPVADVVNKYIDLALQGKRGNEAPRDYLGASHIAEPCARKLAYQYKKEDHGQKFTGRQLRIFECGHVFEDMLAGWLKAAGFHLRTTKLDGGQYGFETAGGRIRGHIDGVILSGPDDPDLLPPDLQYPGGWECKALNDRNWKDIQQKGLRASKGVYYGQVQTYMGYLDLPWFLFTALNKNTQEIYHEVVKFDPATAQALTDRAIDVIKDVESGNLPGRISDKPDHFQCRFCDYKNICWGES